MKTLQLRAKSIGVDQVAMGAGYSGIVQYGSWPTASPYMDETALEYNSITVYQCVRALAETFAMLPLNIYRTGTGKAIAADHELYYTLHTAANPEMSSFTWRELVMGHLGTWGNHYSEKVHDALGRLQLWPIRPDRVIPWYDLSGAKQYDYLSQVGGRTTFKPGTIFHIQGLTSNGLKGISPIEAMGRSLRLLRTAENYGQRFFDNDGRPSLIMSHPKTLSEPAKQRLAAQLDELRGSHNAGKSMVLEEGLSITEIGVSPEAAQFLATRLFQKREIAAGYRIPAHMIGDLERSTNNNIEQQALEFIQNTMQPWFARFEQDAQLQLMDGDTSYEVAFDVDDYLRANPLAQAQIYQIMRNEGVITGNQWAEKVNLPPITDGSGDTYWMPVNYQPSTVEADYEFQPPVNPGLEPGLTVVKSLDRKPMRCPEDNRLLIRLAPIGTVGDCSKCKKTWVMTAAGPIDAAEPAIA